MMDAKTAWLFLTTQGDPAGNVGATCAAIVFRDIRARLEALEARLAVAVPVLPTTGAGNAPPPDDAPRWRDVPAGRALWSTVRKGDRFFTARGYDRWTTAHETFASIRHDDGTHLEVIWIKRHDHPGRKPAPQTVDMIGSELRVGDVVVAKLDTAGNWLVYQTPYPVSDIRAWMPNRTYRVRLPRPNAEPSASGEGIASTRPNSPNLHLLCDVRAWFVGVTWEPVALVAAINAAHEHATRELRERCERAERERDEARKSLMSCATLRTAYQQERDAAIARAEAAERERDEARRELSATEDDCDREREKRKSTEIERDAHKRRSELAERVVEAARRWARSDADVNDCKNLANTLTAYDMRTARRDGGK